MTTKNILIIFGLLTGAVLAISYKKISNLQYAYGKIDITPFGLPKNIEIVNPFKPDGYAKFNIDVSIKNLSDEDFNLSGAGFATLKRLAFIYNGITVGVANVNISEIEVPALDEMIIPNVPVVVSAKNLFGNIANIKDMAAKFSIVGYVEVLGTEYLIGSNE